MPTWDLREAMNATSASLRAERTSSTTPASRWRRRGMVAPPARRRHAVRAGVQGHEHAEPAATSTATTTDRHLVVGQVVGVHLDERYISDDGILDVAAMRPIARCGYTADYSVLDRLFQMERPR